MMRHINLMRHFLANSMMIELEYRAEFFISTLTSVLTFVSGLIVLYSIFQQVPRLGGWSYEQGLVLFGIYLVIQTFIEVILRPNLNRLPDYIRLGTMDFILLKPVNSQFFVFFRFFNIWAAPNFLIGWGVILYAMLKMNSLEFGYILQLILMLIPALVIVFSILCMLITTSFWWIRVDSITILFQTFFETARFPVTAYPKSMQLFLTFIVPVGFMTTVPAHAAFSTISLRVVIIGWLIAAVFLVASHLLWKFALSDYTSASS